MPIHQTNDYPLLQIKENNFINVIQSWIKTWIVHTHKCKHTYIRVYTPKNLKTHTHTHTHTLIK